MIPLGTSIIGKRPDIVCVSVLIRERTQDTGDTNTHTDTQQQQWHQKVYVRMQSRKP